MWIIIIFSCILLFIKFFSVSWNLIDRPVLQRSNLADPVSISILIPARNEENNIARLVDAINQIQYPNWNCFILNDQSTDRTWEIISAIAKEDPRINAINGQQLPEGWLGKNWACHQLANEADGEYYLFLDADIEHIHPRLLQYMLAYAIKKKIGLLSLFPEQRMDSLGERLVVPIMHYLLLATLPLSWIFHLKGSSFSAANGQCMLFRAADYDQFQWHQLVKSEVVEDIAIMSELKRQGLKGMTLLGNNLIRCRMYHSLTEGINGFSKNMLAGFGGKYLLLISYVLISIVFSLLSIFWLEMKYAIFFVAFVLFNRMAISIVSKQHIGWNLLLHPLQLAIFGWISIRSIIKNKNKSLEWKGRKIKS